MCTASGYRPQPIDLRWGVSEAAGTDRQTLRICLDELARCWRLSPDLFLLILLGERYGSYFLPADLPASLVGRLLPHLTSDERWAFEGAYRVDENAVPAEYVLLRAQGPHDASDERLRQALVRAGHAAEVAEAEQLLFAGSATHREIQFGLLGQPPEAGCEAGVLCGVRTFVGDQIGPAVATYTEHDPERIDRVRQLSDAVLTRLPEHQVRRYVVACDGGRGLAFEEDGLVETYLALLRPKLEAVIAARTAARETAAKQGYNGAALANAAFEAERLTQFVGREAPLATIAAYFTAPAAVPLVVSGPGGSGKSTVLARAVEDARTAYPEALVVTRYVGVTPGAESVPTLLDGLRADLAAAYGHELEPLHEDFERSRALRAALAWATAERPLILVVDGIDQLGPAPVSLDWLPEALPPHVHVLVSLLDELDRPEDLVRLRGRQPAPQVIALDKMGAVVGDALLSRWLAETGRTLEHGQRAAVLAAFSPEGRPLHLRLAFEEARRWRSFDDVATRPPLDTTIAGLMTARFRRLEQRKEQGPLVTGHALGMLRAAKNGLAEDELLALLARDPAVRWDLRRGSPSSPPINPELPLPAILWARLYGDLGPYLSEREADGAHLLTYYHRTLADVVTGRYLRGAKGRQRHRELARYFERQALAAGTQPNLRKLAEQPTQEAGGGFTSELHHTLTDVSFLESKIAYQHTAGPLGDLALAPAEDEVLRDITAVLGLGAHVLGRDSGQLENQLRGRLSAAIRAELHDPPERRGPWLRLDSSSLTHVGGMLLRTLSGHVSADYACAFSPDGRLALSSFYDGRPRLWEVGTGQTLRLLEGYIGGVHACAFSPDGRTLLSASADQTLQLWDVTTGQVVRLFKGHGREVHACAFSPDGRTALSVSSDCTLRRWDVANAQQIQVWEYRRPLDCHAFSADSRLILSGSYDGTLRLWDVASGQALHVLEGHRGQVHACAFSPDGRLAVSGADDMTLRLWEVSSGRSLGILEGHTSGVEACAFSPDGRAVLSASQDGTLRLWEVSSGQTLHVLEGHTDGVSACAFSSDGQLAVSFASRRTAAVTSVDRTLRLWEVVSGREIARFDAEAQLSCCAFSPRGWRVVAGDRGGAVHFLTVVGMSDEPTQVVPPEGLPASQPSPVTLAPATPAKADSDRPWWQFWRSRDRDHGGGNTAERVCRQPEK